jgi:hypothetical protein
MVVALAPGVDMGGDKEDAQITRRFHNGMPHSRHQMVDGWQPAIFGVLWDGGLQVSSV